MPLSYYKKLQKFENVCNSQKKKKNRKLYHPCGKVVPPLRKVCSNCVANSTPS
jgi:hypothetical protein